MHGTIPRHQLSNSAAELAALAEQIQCEHAAAEQAWKESVRHAIKCGELLVRAKAKLAHGQWQPWCRKQLKIAARTIRLYCQLASLPPEERQRVATLPLREALKHKLAAKPSFEYWTDERYVEAARKVLGHIDLDPASCDEANKTVGADKIFTKEDDGLKHEWRGRVFLNPPYCGLTAAFVDKLISEYKAGRVTAAILLVNGDHTDAKWFQRLWDDDRWLCFANQRVSGSQQGMTGQAPFNSCFVYFGDEKERFKRAFSKLGTVCGKV
jgi:DNA N-6-adenine-methyltransferase (Dam)